MSPAPPRRPWRLLLLVALVALATPLWLPAIGLALVVSDTLAPADAVVPLAGDLGPRLQSAVDLLEAGYAPRLVITDLTRANDGALESIDYAAQAIARGVGTERLYFSDRVVRSTYAELLAVRDLARLEGWRSLIIVTSPEHTRRTRIMANEAFPDGELNVIVRPVIGQGYDPARWWRGRDQGRLTLAEYPKLLAFLLGYRG